MVIEAPVTQVEWISAEERGLVKELRERVWNELPDNETSKSQDDQDAFLLRFLRARELNLDRSEDMLRQAIKWREENNVDQALTQEIDPFFKENYRWKFLGPDWDGRPAGICPFYDWDFRKMLAANKADQFDNFLKYFFESILRDIRIYNENRKPGQAPVTQFIPILDVNGFAYGQMLSFSAMRKWFQMSATYESKYPEILHRAIFIRCPSYFQMFLNMLKGFLCPRTLGKFICYSNVEDWKKDIDKYVDPAIIPEQYGGTCKVNPLDKSSKIERDVE